MPSYLIPSNPLSIISSDILNKQVAFDNLETFNGFPLYLE